VCQHASASPPQPAPFLGRPQPPFPARASHGRGGEVVHGRLSLQDAPAPPARGGGPHSRADDRRGLHVPGGMHDGQSPQGVVQNNKCVRNI